MSQSVKRIELPSGGWWEIVTRPLWGHVRQWSAASQRQDGSSVLVELALVSITAAWSFREKVSIEAMAQRDPEDLLAVLQVFHREVVPSLEVGSPREMAEALFAGLVAGQLPAQLDEVYLMAATGWSWQDLQATPADVVQKMAVYLAVKCARDSSGALDFRAPEDGPDDY